MLRPNLKSISYLQTPEAPGLRFEVQVVAGIEVALAIEEQKAAA